MRALQKDQFLTKSKLRRTLDKTKGIDPMSPVIIRVGDEHYAVEGVEINKVGNDTIITLQAYVPPAKGIGAKAKARIGNVLAKAVGKVAS